jgi:hypothetical protein
MHQLTSNGLMYNGKGVDGNKSQISEAAVWITFNLQHLIGA